MILAHNHPGGRAYPSGEDIRATSRLQGLLKMVDIDLVDHFIIAGIQLEVDGTDGGTVGNPCL